MGGLWSSGYTGGSRHNANEVDTGVDREHLTHLADRLLTIPDSLTVHRKIARMLRQRREMQTGERPLDWGAAEALAFASLAIDGHRVRLSGQDCGRGTFSHRHAVLHDFGDGHTHTPLQHLTDNQAPVEIYNSPLSEAAVLAYEYGYSLDNPDGLTMWEAQFGDFSNVAQAIIDQFISSGEDKWSRLSSLVLLLPHAFEGQGPEHSSARLERFLALCAEDNIQVIYPSTPAQYFHALRRQVIRNWRKPLIVMSPKSLLRHPRSTSSLEDISTGRFATILPDPNPCDQGQHSQVVISSGKIFFELEDYRKKHQKENTALLRLEQLYPLADEEIAEALKPYPDTAKVVWVQDEPENMGPWRYLRHRFGAKLLGTHPFCGVYRPESASPATGSHSSHKAEAELLMQQAFA